MTHDRRYLRVSQIVGDRKRGITPLIPVSRSTWWAGVKTGRFPKPVKPFGGSITVWLASDIQALIDSDVEIKRPSPAVIEDWRDKELRKRSQTCARFLIDLIEAYENGDLSNDPGNNIFEFYRKACSLRVVFGFSLPAIPSRCRGQRLELAKLMRGQKN